MELVINGSEGEFLMCRWEDEKNGRNENNIPQYNIVYKKTIIYLRDFIQTKEKKRTNGDDDDDGEENNNNNNK